MQRSEALARLLEETGFTGATRTPLAADASTRRYERLQLGDRHAMLMDAPPSKEVAVFGAVWIRAAVASYAQQVDDIERFERGDRARA